MNCMYEISQYEKSISSFLDLFLQENMCEMI